MRCEWTIRAAAAVSLAFASFDTEAGYDFVKVYVGVPGAQALRQPEIFSGTIERSQPVAAPSGVMTVLFTTDGSVTSRGFVASWSTISRRTASTSPRQPVRGVAAASAVDMSYTYECMEGVEKRVCAACLAAGAPTSCWAGCKQASAGKIQSIIAEKCEPTSAGTLALATESLRSDIAAVAREDFMPRVATTQQAEMSGTSSLHVLGTSWLLLVVTATVCRN